MPEPDAVFELDRARVRASFERASVGYEAASRLQARFTPMMPLLKQ